MHYEQFVQKVQEYGGLKDAAEAAKVMQATIETMSECMPRTHREHLAAQLPEELRSRFPRNQHMEYFTLEEFYQRIGNRADSSDRNAVKYAEGVARVLREAVGRGELNDILEVFLTNITNYLAGNRAAPYRRHRYE
jgi:uncharacterized protein (DUF2267 family)